MLRAYRSAVVLQKPKTTRRVRIHEEPGAIKNLAQQSSQRYDWPVEALESKLPKKTEKFPTTSPFELGTDRIEKETKATRKALHFVRLDRQRLPVRSA
jgi:hypothetical protein